MQSRVYKLLSGRQDGALTPDEDTELEEFLQLDHIISRKHGGRSEADNLAYACLRCNAWKGSDLGSLQETTGRLIPLFHPRRQRWLDHFQLAGAFIEPLTEEGIVTGRLLKLNLDKRVIERKLLIALGRYPRA